MAIKKIKNATLLMIIGALISKIVGFIRDIFLARIYGTSATMDAYVISHTIPNIILACIGVAISNTILSVYSKEKRKNGEDGAKLVLDSANFIIIVMSVTVIVLTIIFSNSLVRIIASGFDSNTLMLASKLTKITSFSIIFISLNYVLNGFLQYKNKFFLTSFSGSFSSIIIIIFAIMKIDNIYYYSAAWAIGAIIQFLTVFIHSKRNGYTFGIKIKNSSKYIKNILYLSLPLMISYSIQQINIIVDKSIASSLFSGAVSSLNYANIIITSITAIIITSIVSVQYSKMTKFENKAQMYNFANKTIDTMSIIMIPIVLLIMAFSKEIIYILFYGGNFDEIALKNTYMALIFYSIGLIFISYRDVLIRVCLVENNSKLPMISNISAVIVNIVLNIALSRKFGHIGLTMATSISLFISMMILLILSKIRFKEIFVQENLIKLVKVLMSIPLALLVIFIFNNFFENYIYINKLICLLFVGITSIFALVVYSFGLKILKIDIINELKFAFKK